MSASEDLGAAGLSWPEPTPASPGEASMTPKGTAASHTSERDLGRGSAAAAATAHAGGKDEDKAWLAVSWEPAFDVEHMASPKADLRALLSRPTRRFVIFPRARLVLHEAQDRAAVRFGWADDEEEGADKERRRRFRVLDDVQLPRARILELCVYADSGCPVDARRLARLCRDGTRLREVKVRLCDGDEGPASEAVKTTRAEYSSTCLVSRDASLADLVAKVVQQETGPAKHEDEARGPTRGLVLRDGTDSKGKKKTGGKKHDHAKVRLDVLPSSSPLALDATVESLNLKDGDVIKIAYAPNSRAVVVPDEAPSRDVTSRPGSAHVWGFSKVEAEETEAASSVEPIADVGVFPSEPARDDEAPALEAVEAGRAAAPITPRDAAEARMLETLGKLKLTELKDACRAKGLSVTGNKEDLVGYLMGKPKLKPKRKPDDGRPRRPIGRPPKRRRGVRRQPPEAPRPPQPDGAAKRALVEHSENQPETTKRPQSPTCVSSSDESADLRLPLREPQQLRNSPPETQKHPGADAPPGKGGQKTTALDGQRRPR